MNPWLTAAAIAVAIYIAALAALFLTGRRTAARELAALIPNLLLLFKGLVTDRRVPRRSKVLLVLGAVWLASPIDLIPEFVPLLGPLDDAIVAALILRHVLRVAGPKVIADHWRGDQSTLARIIRVSGSDSGSASREPSEP